MILVKVFWLYLFQLRDNVGFGSIKAMKADDNVFFLLEIRKKFHFPGVNYCPPWSGLVLCIMGFVVFIQVKWTHLG